MDELTNYGALCTASLAVNHCIENLELMDIEKLPKTERAEFTIALEEARRLWERTQLMLQVLGGDLSTKLGIED